MIDIVGFYQTSVYEANVFRGVFKKTVEILDKYATVYDQRKNCEISSFGYFSLNNVY